MIIPFFLANFKSHIWDIFICNSDGYGGWSSEGCRIIGTNSDRVICECDHMTNFAIIFDPYAGNLKPKSTTHEKILGIISFIGIGLSLGGLFLTLLTLLLFRWAFISFLKDYYKTFILVVLSTVDFCTKRSGLSLVVSAIIHIFYLSMCSVQLISFSKFI